MSIETYPANLGQSVIVTLANGTETPAYWDGVQWWIGLENDDQDAPLMNDFVVAWRQ